MILRDIPLALVLALRELRAGQRRFGVFLGCMFLGVFAIAAVGSISESIRGALARDSRSLLGGDVSIQFATQNPTDEELAWLRDRGEVSRVITMRGMARTASDETTLVALKAIDDAYPLYGSVETAPAPWPSAPQPTRPNPASPSAHAATLQQLLGDATCPAPAASTGTTAAIPGVLPSEQPNMLPGVLVDPLLLERLNIAVGQQLVLGAQPFCIRGVLLSEPDRIVQGITYGPRVLVSMPALERTGLMLPGSLMDNYLRLRLPTHGGAPAGEDHVATFMAQAREAFPHAGWRMDAHSRSLPRIRTLLDRMDANLTLIGVAALLVGGIGMAEGVRGYLASRIQTIATLKCVGGDGTTIVWAYLFQLLCIGAAGIVAGCMAGALVPLAAGRLLAHLLPLTLDTTLHMAPLFKAALMGTAILVAFSLHPLLLAVRVPPAVLFRGYTVTDPQRLTVGGRVLVAAAFAVLVGLVFAFTPDQKLAWGFLGVVTGCFLLFRLVAWALQACTRSLFPGGQTYPNDGGQGTALPNAPSRYPSIRSALPSIRSALPNIRSALQRLHPSIRLGLAAIHRPGAPTRHLVLALGLGLTALVAIAQTERNLNQSLERDLTRDAPAFFFINILPDQLATIEKLGTLPGVTRMDRGPMVRGRITHINNTPVEEAAIAPETQWAVRGDRGLSHAATPPADTELTSGEWWPPDYSGPPRISLSDDLAKGFGVTVGDTLSFNILGRQVTATIANVRKVDWMTFQLQFAVLFAPGLLDKAPVTWVVTAYGAGPGMDALYRQMTREHPGITAISLREILAEVRTLMARMGLMFRAMAGIMLATGLMVLAGAVLADRHRRLYDAVIYKVCGATRGDILLALVVEFLTIGLATGLCSALSGTLAAWAAVHGLLHLNFTVFPAQVIATIGACVGFALLFGLAGTARVLGESPAPHLRNE